MITIIDYEAGNLRSVERALRHLDIACRITSSAEEILSSDRVIFPGVGAAGKAMEVIRSRNLLQVIHAVIARKTPFLGICLGAQILLDRSEENNAECLKIISGTARKFTGESLKIPHMGWNNLSVSCPHPILEGIDPEAQFYFVHSYYPEPAKLENIIATTDYGVRFASVIGSANVVATQFHPEKSGREGLRILENFSKWNGKPDHRDTCASTA
jgi:glutamine amidotransferase